MLERGLVHVLSQPGEVVLLRKHLRHLVEDLPVAPVQVSPRLVQPPQGGALHRGEDGEQLEKAQKRLISSGRGPHSTLYSILASGPAAPGSIISSRDFYSRNYFWNYLKLNDSRTA